jgi:CheY-like chemotaxis protein
MVEALAGIDKTKPDVIVSDYMMPEMNGKSFFEYQESNIYQSIPFIMVTANMEEGQIPPVKMVSMTL